MNYRRAIELLEEMASTPAQMSAVEVAVGAMQDVMEAGRVLRERGTREVPLSEMREVLAGVLQQNRRKKGRA